MRWRFRSRLKSSQHLAAARIHNPGGRFQASCCIRAFGQERPVVVAMQCELRHDAPTSQRFIERRQSP